MSGVSTWAKGDKQIGENHMNVVAIAVGGLLLVFGRRLFWLFVGAVGFLIGLSLAARFFPGNDSLALIVGLVVGGLTALLAVSVQRMAVLLAGFLAGGYVLMNLIGMFATGASTSWLPFLIGGILGAVLLSMLFDWALVVLTSLVGAVLIVQYGQIGSSYGLVAVVGLTTIGIVLQALLKRH
jgi:hypothetical protein